MNTEIDKAVQIPAGSPEARELAASLRQRSESERFEFIQCLLSRQPVLALQLANACLRERHYFDALLHKGFKRQMRVPFNFGSRPLFLALARVVFLPRLKSL